MGVVVFLVLLLAMTGHSSALYCVCKDGVGDSTLQKTLDYACGAGADCTPILQNGVCFNPNTVKDHCSYAVNSYFQRKGQATGSCDFSGTATPTQAIPTQSSTCVYPSSPSPTGTGSTTNPGTTTPGTMTPGTTNPGTTTPGTTTPGTMTPGSTTPGTTTNPPIFGGSGLGPSGNGGIPDSAEAVLLSNSNLFCSLALTLCLSGLLLLWG